MATDNNVDFPNGKVFTDFFKDNILPTITTKAIIWLGGLGRLCGEAESRLSCPNEDFVKSDNLYIVKKVCYSGPTNRKVQGLVNTVDESVLKIRNILQADNQCDKLITLVVRGMFEGQTVGHVNVLNIEVKNSRFTSFHVFDPNPGRKKSLSVLSDIITRLLHDNSLLRTYRVSSYACLNNATGICSILCVEMIAKYLDKSVIYPFHSPMIKNKAYERRYDFRKRKFN